MERPYGLSFFMRGFRCKFLRISPRPGGMEGRVFTLRRCLFVAAALFGLSSLATAQPVTGPYVSLGAGGNLLQDETLRLDENFPDGKFRFDIGEAGSGAAGYGFGNGFRVEIEGDYRHNSLRQFLGTGFPTSAGGDQANYGGMLNGFFDMDIGLPWIYPYLGLGVGYSVTHLSGLSVTAPNGGYSFAATGESGNFAYQGIFGVSLPVSALPGLSFTAEYRFFSALGPEGFDGTSLGTEGAYGTKPYGLARGNADITADYNHSALIGLRYELFPPPRPAPPSPPAPLTATPAPPAESRTYLVFFDWDRADLSSRGRQIVAEAATASTHVQITRIDVNGYTEAVHSARRDGRGRTDPRRRSQGRDRHPRLRRARSAGAHRQGRAGAPE
jgi:OOP family OmpA-OmpF porin